MDVLAAEATKPTVTAIHPDFADGDIQLVPADRACCFRVQSSTLRRASQFFADMFTNAQPDGAQIVLGEDKDTLEILLSVASGASLPIDRLGDLERLERVAYAAEKYEMGTVQDLVRLMLRTKEVHRPDLALRRYALATHFSWTDIARDTLLAALDIDLSSALLPANVDARELMRLVSLRERRVKMFVEHVDETLRRACNCPLSASLDPHGARWTECKKAMVLAILSRPSGSTVLTADAGAIDSFRAVICSSPLHTGRRYLWEITEREIRALVARLPSTL